MAVVTSDLLAGITTNFRALWEDQFLAAAAQRLVAVLATEVPSNTDTESYSWLGTVPRMSEWIAERKFEGLLPADFAIKNRDWEVSMDVDRNVIEDDRLGIVRPRIMQLAQEAARHPDELLFQVIAAGGTGLAYDGQPFFSATHAEGESGTQANTVSGSGVEVEDLANDYQAARAAMRLMKDDRGRVMGLRPTHVLAPPALEGPFRRLLQSEYFPTAGLTGASANIWRGSAELVIAPYLTDSNDWFLLSLDQPVKPFIFQNRRPPQFTALDNPTDENVFMRRRFLYGVDARYNVGYGLWQLAYRVTN
jgi:phage major head subunit gpT-like protein